MTPNELTRHFPHGSKSFLARNAAQNPIDRPPPSPIPKCAVRDEPLAAAQGEEKNLGRVIVRIKSFRTRLLDPDNLCPKYFIDGLRYAGLIRGDSQADIILQVSQEKVAKRKDEYTSIEIEPVGQEAKSVQASMTLRQALIAKLWESCGDSWNRQAFDTFMETLGEEDLRQYIAVGRT